MRAAGDSDAAAGPARRHEDLRHRIHWLLFFRLALAIFGIALLLLLEGGRMPFSAPYAIFVGLAALDAVWAAALRRARDLGRFAALQIAVDTALVAALAYLTGGVYSFAAFLFFGPILAASLCVSGRTSMLFASAASVAIAAIQLLYYLAAHYQIALPLVDPDVVDEARLRVGRDTSYLIAQGVAFHVVAGLSSWVAQELKRVKILYSEILEKMAQGLVAIEADGRIVFVNDEARRLFRYEKPGSLAGLDFREVFRRRGARALLDCLLSPEPVVCEVEVETRAGEKKSVEVKTSVLRDDRGIVRGTIGIFTDLTLKKQAEEAARRAERPEGIEALAMGIAHEMRNPLASIRGCVQELGRLEYLGEDERQLARIVCRESDRLDAIIAEFLRFARLKPPSIAEVDLAALLREVAVLLRGRVRGEAVSIAVGGAQVARAQGDAHLLTQVLLNLGINAIDAIQAGGAGAAEGAGAGDAWGGGATGGAGGAGGTRGRVRLSCRETRFVRQKANFDGRRLFDDAPGWEIAVEDDGPGIPPEDLARIFTPFFTTKPGGTGLGLAIADRIVKAHGGRIAIESERGRGTTVRVLLPSAARVAEPDAAAYNS